MPTELEMGLAMHLRLLGLPEPVHQYRFCERMWRIDLAYPDRTPPLAIEVEGGTWAGGRHIQPSGFRRDVDKYNELALRGWMLLRFTSDQIRSGEAASTIERALRERREKE